jgi:hypothetical protein
LAKSASLVAREALRLAGRAAAERGGGARFGKRALRGTKVDKSKAPATVRGRCIRKKAERRKADPSPTFAKNSRPGFGMTTQCAGGRLKRKADPSPTFAKNRRPGFGMTAEARARGWREKQIPHTAKLRRVRNDGTKQGERCRPEGTALHGQQRKKQVPRCTSLEARDRRDDRYARETAGTDM